METDLSSPHDLSEVLRRPEVRRLCELLAEREDAIVTVSATDGRLLWSSRSGSQALFGREPSEFEGHDRFSYVHDDDRDHVRRSFADAVDGNVSRYTFRARTADSDWRRVTSLTWLTEGPSGTVLVTVTLPADAPPPDLAYLTRLGGKRL